jgi:hypothetical protein
MRMKVLMMEIASMEMHLLIYSINEDKILLFKEGLYHLMKMM